MGFEPMIEGDDLRRRVRLGKTKFRQLDNLLNLPAKYPRFGKLVFSHLTRRWTRNVPGHGLSSTLRLRPEGEGGAT